MLELGSYVSTSKIPLQLMSRRDLPTTRILVGSRVRHASPAHTPIHQATIKMSIQLMSSGICPQPGSWWGPGFDTPALHTHAPINQATEQNAATVDEQSGLAHNQDLGGVQGSTRQPCTHTPIHQATDKIPLQFMGSLDNGHVPPTKVLVGPGPMKDQGKVQ